MGLATFTEKILNGKLHFLRSVKCVIKKIILRLLRGRLYGEFQPEAPGWNICWLYEIFSPGGDLNIYFQPGLKILAPNKILISIFKMAAQIYKFLLKQLLWQSAILLSLHLRLYGIISIFKLHQAKQNIKVLSYLSRKRNIILKKTKYIKARNLHRKKDLCGFVLQKERTFWILFLFDFFCRASNFSARAEISNRLHR